jgi:hypothetical protein
MHLWTISFCKSLQFNAIYIFMQIYCILFKIMHFKFGSFRRMNIVFYLQFKLLYI